VSERCTSTQIVPPWSSTLTERSRTIPS
jgi:hypothetical protein